MVKIRLTRTGKKNAPSFRIVVADSAAPRDGRHIEILGHYNPSHNPTLISLNEERYDHWVSVGAQPSKAVKDIKEGKYNFIPYSRQNEKDENASEQPQAKEEVTKEEEVKEETPKE